MAARNIFAIFTSAALIIVNGGRLNLNKRSSHGKGSLTSCGTKGATKASIDREVNMSIVNGRPATECEWRWQVGLRFDAGGRPFCGGQLITPDWVLTAAHCVGTPNFEVVAGEYRPGEPSGNEQSQLATQVFRHPQYSSRTFDWDMALVRLERPMEINDCVGTVCLPTEGNDVPAGTKCWISGWGTLASGGDAPEVLQEAEVEILSQEACRASGNGDEILDSMICAQGRLANGSIVDACQGDSGGPLVCESGGQWTVYGATSWGRGCAAETHPGVWARVHEGTGWIEEIMAANEGPAPTRARCPDFARQPFPDMDGDCQCNHGQFCSVSNGANRDCPTSGGIGAYGGRYFQPDCEECQCYGTTAMQALPEVGESKKGSS